jgi:adenosine deaminase
LKWHQLNFQTKAIDTLATYPFKKLLDAGVRVTINTDNRTVSDTTLNDEYEKIASWYDLSEAEFRQIGRHAFEASFMSPEQREILEKEF